MKLTGKLGFQQCHLVTRLASQHHPEVYWAVLSTYPTTGVFFSPAEVPESLFCSDTVLKKKYPGTSECGNAPRVKEHLCSPDTELLAVSHNIYILL